MRKTRPHIIGIAHAFGSPTLGGANPRRIIQIKRTHADASKIGIILIALDDRPTNVEGGYAARTPSHIERSRGNDTKTQHECISIVGVGSRSLAQRPRGEPTQ